MAQQLNAKHLRKVEENWRGPQRSLRVYVRECNEDLLPDEWVTVMLFGEEGYFLDKENFDGGPRLLFSGSLKNNSQVESSGWEN